MRYTSRRAVGNLFGELVDIFMEKPLLGGLLIAAVLTLYWLILPHWRDRMGGLTSEQYIGLKVIIALVSIGLLFVLRTVI